MGRTNVDSGSAREGGQQLESRKLVRGGNWGKTLAKTGCYLKPASAMELDQAESGPI